eukprot:1113682-Amphidinium_carterae.1
MVETTELIPPIVAPLPVCASLDSFDVIIPVYFLWAMMCKGVTQRTCESPRGASCLRTTSSVGLVVANLINASALGLSQSG